MELRTLAAFDVLHSDALPFSVSLWLAEVLAFEAADGDHLLFLFFFLF